MAIVVLTTKYLAPTDTLGARIAVNGPRGRVVYAFNCAEETVKQHASCADAYISCDDDLLSLRLSIEDVHHKKGGYIYFFRYTKQGR